MAAPVANLNLTTAGGRTPGNDIITPSQCTILRSDGYNRHTEADYNVYKVFGIVRMRFLRFRDCKNANGPKKKQSAPAHQFEDGIGDSNLVPTYCSILEVWKHSD